MWGASDCQFVGGDTSRWDYSGALDNVQAGLDVAGMLPVAGEVFDGANAVIYAARGDAANAALSAAAMIPGAGNGATAAKLAGKYGDEAAAAIAHTMCSFSADTPVATPDGDVPIAKVQVGDQVLAFDEQVGTTGAYTVTAVLAHRDPLIVTLTVGGERIETTPEHPFFVAGSGWRAAGDLNVGDELWGIGSAASRVEAIEVKATPQVMYNLTVAVAHTFFVGDDGWLVHNTCPIPMSEAVEQAVNHVGSGAIAEITRGGNVQFRNTFLNAAGDVESRMSRLDVNPGDPHVARIGPHLNLETHINRRPVRNDHIPIDPSTVRRGDYQ